LLGVGLLNRARFSSTKSTRDGVDYGEIIVVHLFGTTPAPFMPFFIPRSGSRLPGSFTSLLTPWLSVSISSILLLIPSIPLTVLLISFYNKESNKLSIFDELLNQWPQGYTSLGSVAVTIMKGTILVCWARRRDPVYRSPFLVYGIPLYLHEDLRDWSI